VPASVAQATKSQFEASMAGAGNAGKWVVMTQPTGGKVTMQQFTGGEESLSYLVSGDAMRNTIANAFDVPIALLTMDTAALAQAKEAIPQWQELALRPRCQRMEDTINHRLTSIFREVLGDPDLIVMFDDPVRRDFRADVGAMVAAAGGPVMTTNEARNELDLQAIPNGDTLAKPAMPQASPMASPWAAVGALPPEGTRQAAAAPEVAPQATPEAVEVTAKSQHREPCPIFGRPAHDKCCDHAPRTKRASGPRHKSAAASVDPLTEQLAKAVANWFKLLEPAMLAAAQSGVVLGIENDPGLVDAFAEKTFGPWGKIFIAGQQAEAAKIGEPVESALTANAQRYIVEQQRQVARNITEAASRQVRQALADAIQQGDTPAEQVARIKEIITDAKGYVADGIARTQTATAYVQGRIETWKTSGRVAGREWLPSGNPCKLCAGLGGLKTTLDQPFVKAGQQIGASGITAKRDIWNVPAHPNCSCDEAAIFKDIE